MGYPNRAFSIHRLLTRRWAIMMLGSALLCLPCPADDGAAARASGLLLEGLRADGGTGVQAAVLVDGEIVWSEALGAADLEAGVAMQRHSRLRIGSVSKVMTAALVGRLIDSGQLHPQAAVRDVLSSFPAKPFPIPLATLGDHTSGIRHYDFANLGEANNTHRYDSVTDALVVFADDPLLSQPGTVFHYSSFGYNVLGAVAETASGVPFLDLLDRTVLHPLALDSSGGDRALELVPGRARFYTVMQDGTVINTLWRDSSDYYPSGGLLSSAEDLVRLAWNVFGAPPNTSHFGRRSRELFRSARETADGAPLPYTFGWQIQRQEDGTVAWYGHGGLTNGATAELRFLPKQRLAVAVIANYNFWFDGHPEVIRVSVEELPTLFAKAHTEGGSHPPEGTR